MKPHRFLCATALFLMGMTLSQPLSAADPLETCRTLYQNGSPKTLEGCKVAAEADKAEAQKYIGDLYYWGWGRGADTQRDLTQAHFWYRKAGTNGDTEAKYNLGVMYENGEGAEMDYAKALSWYNTAAEDGHRDAQFNLANMFSKGLGTKPNQRQATKWYSRAAAQGEPSSQYNLANRYASGNGIEVDLVEAYKWYGIAFKSGVNEAEKSMNAIVGELKPEEVSKAIAQMEKWKPVKEERPARDKQ